VEHIERWSLFRGMPVPMNDAHVQEHVLPNVRAAQE
jgi:hypothetical protein